MRAIGEADGDDEGRAFENAKPVGDVRVVEVVVQVCRAARDEDRAEHAHVERLDIRDHGKPRARTRLLREVDAERAAVQCEDGRDEIVEEHVDDEGFHGAACRLLLREADGHGDGEENRHLREHRPRALLDDVPKIVPKGSFGGNAAEKPRVLADDGNRHRQAEEREQYDGRVHRAAEPLHVLHEDILAE